MSGPGRWYYRGTMPMRRVHWAVERRAARLVTRTWLKTRVSPAGGIRCRSPGRGGEPRIAPTPFLVVHGDQDRVLPGGPCLTSSTRAAREPKELWVVPGFGHAERGVSNDLTDRIGRWVQQATLLTEAYCRAARPWTASPAAGAGGSRVEPTD